MPTIPDDIPPPQPHGNTPEQVADMEAEGQAQTQGRRPARRGGALAPRDESAAEDQAIDTAATGLVSSDDDEGHAA